MDVPVFALDLSRVAAAQELIPWLPWICHQLVLACQLRGLRLAASRESVEAWSFLLCAGAQGAGSGVAQRLPWVTVSLFFSI